MSIQDGTTFYVYVYGVRHARPFMSLTRLGVVCGGVCRNSYVCAATGDRYGYRQPVPVPVRFRFRYRCMYVCACRCVTVCEAEESPVWLCPLPMCRLGIVVDCRVSTDWSAFPRVSGFAFRSAATVGVGRFFSLPRVPCPILCELRAERRDT